MNFYLLFNNFHGKVNIRFVSSHAIPKCEYCNPNRHEMQCNCPVYSNW